jgi:hypothetical protein
VCVCVCVCVCKYIYIYIYVCVSLSQNHALMHTLQAVEVATLAASEQYHVAEVLRANPAVLRELLESIRLSALKNVELSGNSLGR